MIEFGYLHKGLCGLAQSHKAGTMAGHLGAAVVAGYFFGEDRSELDEEVHRGVEGELERVIAGDEAIWFNAKQKGITPTELFSDMPVAGEASVAITPIVDAIRKNVATLKQSGHNIIFASIAMRALSDHPEYATQSMVDGIAKLIAAFNTTNGGRGYYGKEQLWKEAAQVKLQDEDESFPPYQSVHAMAEVTVRELIATAAIKKQGFGGLWHVINHAAAIVEFERFGFKDVAKLALPAHQHHIQLWRSLPDVAAELGATVKSEHSPLEPIYWRGALKRDEARLTHRVKTLYGFYTIRQLIESDQLQREADDAFLYLMS